MRSLLFVPGDRPERFAKALASGADAVICDFEDAVTPATRSQARRNVADLLRTTGRSVPLWVRINPVQTSDALADLAAVVAARPDGIVLRRRATAPTCTGSITGSRRSKCNTATRAAPSR